MILRCCKTFSGSQVFVYEGPVPGALSCFKLFARPFFGHFGGLPRGVAGNSAGHVQFRVGTHLSPVAGQQARKNKSQLAANIQSMRKHQ